MHASRLALFLLVYVTLDFANPLMPGAVRFDGGSVDAVHADRARPLTPSVPVEFVPMPETVGDRPTDVQSFRRASLVFEPRRLAATRIRRAPLSSSDPPALSEAH